MTDFPCQAEYTTSVRLSLSAATPAVLSLVSVLAGDGREPTPLTYQELSTHIRALDDERFTVRDRAYAALRAASLDFDGLHQLVTSMNEGSLEVRRRVERLVDVHREKLHTAIRARAHCLSGQYRMMATPRNCPDGAWLYAPHMQDFAPPRYLEQLCGKNAWNIENIYLQRAKDAGAPSDGSPRWTNYLVASDLFVTEWLQEAVIHHYGERDFYDRMTEQALAARNLLERMAIADDDWRRNNKLPSLLIPIALEPEQETGEKSR